MDFVNFDLAKKLKEKGFPQVKRDALAMYNEEGEWFSLAKNLDEFEYSFEDFDDRDCVCPTISQVLKWLREEHKVYIEPCILADCDTDADNKVINTYTYWSFSITNIETGDMIYYEYEHIDDKRFNSYEQAAIAGISYVLDNLI